MGEISFLKHNKLIDAHTKEEVNDTQMDFQLHAVYKKLHDNENTIEIREFEKATLQLTRSTKRLYDRIKDLTTIGYIIEGEPAPVTWFTKIEMEAESGLIHFEFNPLILKYIGISENNITTFF